MPSSNEFEKFLNPYAKPEEMYTKTNSQFSGAAQDRSEQQYVFEGDFQEYTYLLNGVQIEATKVVAQVAKTAPSGITVLDIGTGKGGFPNHIQNKSIEAFGISARDMRAEIEKNNLDEKHYLIGNAEYINDGEHDPNRNKLQNLLPQHGFNLIFSQKTFIHLVDPLGTIIQAYDLLKPGGILLIDQFHIRGLEDKFHSLIQYLQDNNYQVFADIKAGDVYGLLIQKSSDRNQATLKLPISYQNSSTAAPYEAHFSLESDEAILPQIYESGRQIILNQIAQNKDLNKIHNQTPNLSTLLNNESYKELCWQDQLLLIWGKAAQSTSIEDYLELELSLKRKFAINRYPKDILNIINTSQQDAITLFTWNDNFKNLPTDVQEEVIQYAACHSFIIYKYANDLKNAADTLGLDGSQISAMHGFEQSTDPNPKIDFKKTKESKMGLQSTSSPNLPEQPRFFLGEKNPFKTEEESEPKEYPTRKA